MGDSWLRVEGVHLSRCFLEDWVRVGEESRRRNWSQDATGRRRSRGGEAGLRWVGGGAVRRVRKKSGRLVVNVRRRRGREIDGGARLTRQESCRSRSLSSFLSLPLCFLVVCCFSFADCRFTFSSEVGTEVGVGRGGLCGVRDVEGWNRRVEGEMGRRS